MKVFAPQFFLMLALLVFSAPLALEAKKEKITLKQRFEALEKEGKKIPLALVPQLMVREEKDGAKVVVGESDLPTAFESTADHIVDLFNKQFGVGLFERVDEKTLKADKKWFGGYNWAEADYPMYTLYIIQGGHLLRQSSAAKTEVSYALTLTVFLNELQEKKGKKKPKGLERITFFVTENYTPLPPGYSTKAEELSKILNPAKVVPEIKEKLTEKITKLAEKNS